MWRRRRGEEYRRMGVAFTALGGPRLVRVPGSEFDEFVTGRGRSCCQPSLPSLVECHLMRGCIMMWIYLHINDGLFQEARKSANIDGERATYAPLGWPPGCEEAWRKCAHMSKDLREGRIRTPVYSRFADITELRAPVDARSGNKKRLGPQGNDYRLVES
jgi:hypothetical protein